MVRYLAALLLASTGVACTAQQLPDAANSPQKPSSLLQPALDSVAHAGSGVDLNRWKGSSAARDEVDGYLASMQKDLKSTLPPLLTAADAAPSSAAASLPVLLNLDALYDVLLRVAVVAKTSAPRDQSTALEQSATLLDAARRDLGSNVLAETQAEERHANDLQALLQQQAAAAAATQPTTPVAQAQPAASKPKKRRATPKPAAPATATP